jgi:competence protein CoiA
MLTALEVKNRQLITLLQKTNEEIAVYKASSFLCPVCKQSVTIKAGTIKIPHFAHRKAQSCQYESEAETKEHLELKRLLAEWCQKEQLPVQVEPYLSKLKQRPDLLIGRLALEIQCSPLSLRRFQERTMTYKRYGYQVIWICGKQLCSFQQLTELTRQMSCYSQQLGFYLWQADWQQKLLTLVFHLEESQTNHFYFSKKSWSFQQGKLLDILKYPQVSRLYVCRKYPLAPLLQDYFNQLTQQLVYKSKNLVKLQTYFYQQNEHVLQLPYWFYYPGIRLYPLKESDLYIKHLVWQALQKASAVYYSKEQLYIKIKTAVASGAVYFRNYPNIDPEFLLNLCTQKLFIWLLECGVIQKKQQKYYLLLPKKEQNKQYLKNQYKSYKNLHFISVTPAKI